MSKHHPMRVLDMPQLARAVPHLPPEVLHEVIRHAGLERCVDLVEAATPEQLVSILDLDLWAAAQPEQDEIFDADRFGGWIESLVERDARGAAATVSRFDPSLVAMGLARYVRVFDPGVLEPTAESDDEAPENGLFETTGPSAEVGGYIVQERRAGAWDAIVSLLVELAAAQPECFHAVMHGCRRLSDSGRERDGLDDLLEPAEQLEHELALGREDRRGRSGFTSPADARAFLALAREARSAERPENPVAAACLRATASASIDAGRTEPYAALRSAALEITPLDPEAAAALDGLAQALAAQGRLPEPPGGPSGGERAPGRAPSALRPLMEYLREKNPELCHARGQELAFLANSLVAGCSLQSRSFTPREATDAVVATCSLGLLRQPAPPAADFLVGHDLIAVFEEGWAALHRDVSLFVAEGLLAVLRGLRAGDSDTLAGLYALRHSLETQLAAGTPWLSREALDVIATLDTPAWYGLLGLLGECPVIPAVVSAIVERRTGRIDPKAFEWIATNADLDKVRAFVTRLPELLG
jgi:hypothetical protein